MEQIWVKNSIEELLETHKYYMSKGIYLNMTDTLLFKDLFPKQDNNMIIMIARLMREVNDVSAEKKKAFKRIKELENDSWIRKIFYRIFKKKKFSWEEIISLERENKEIKAKSEYLTSVVEEQIEHINELTDLCNKMHREYRLEKDGVDIGEPPETL